MIKKEKRIRVLSVLFFFVFLHSSPTIAEGKAVSKKSAVPPFAASKLIQSDDTLTLAPDGTHVFEVGFKNTGTKPWNISKTTSLLLQSSATRESFFHDASWVSPIILASHSGNVAPGRVVYFKAILHAPKKIGSYTEQMRLVLGGKIVPSSNISIPIQVKVGIAKAPSKKVVPLAAAPIVASPVRNPVLTVSAMRLIQSDTKLTMPAFWRNAFEIGFKNTGTTAWPASGPAGLVLRSFAKRESYFHDQSWAGPNSVTPLKSGGAPGELVYFNFVLNAPESPGTYTEHLALFSGATQLPGTDVFIPIVVTKRLPQTTLASYTVPGVPSTPASTSVPSTFVPQGIVDDLRDQEKTIRIGITHSNDPIQITASKDYDVRDTAGTLLGSQVSGAATTVLYDRATKLYSVTLPTGNITSANPVRFTGSSTQTASARGGVRAATIENTATSTATSTQATLPSSVSSVPSVPSGSPDQDTIFTVLSYSNRPGWSTTINDNKFRAALEVRYATSTDRVWVINELLFEQYLKGIAETSNSSPYEYQKALLIAARTYGLYHIRRSTKYASENFTIRTTDADQVYRGYNAEIRLSNVSRAVQETRGVVVTYQNVLAITPYYSQSDGRTRSWEEVWAGGPYPWLVGKPDPGCAGLPMLGHGVGMSARGALLMALEGKGFEEILKYYYTGIEIHRMY